MLSGMLRTNRLICLAGCLLAILFLASQTRRVFGVLAQCRARRPLVLGIRRG